MLGKVN